MTNSPKPSRSIKLTDRAYYYFDTILKVLSEHARDLRYFFERGLARVIAAAFVFVSGFFVNPFHERRSVLGKLFIGVPKAFLGLIFLIVLSIVSLAFILVGGTLSSILGLRNIAQYSLKEQIAAWLSLIAVFVALPLVLSDFALYRVSLIFCYVLILVGFDFLYGQCGIITLGHAAFVLLGSYMTVFLYLGTFGVKFSYFASMGIAASVSFVLGICLGFPSLRVKDYYLVIITLAFMLSVPQFLTSRHMSAYSGIASGGLSITQAPPPAYFSWMSQSTCNYFFVIGVALFLIIFAYNLIHHSQIGRAFRTIKCDVEISMIMGIPVVRYKLLAFALSAFYGSVAGSLLTYSSRFIAPESYTLHESIDYIVAEVISGPGSILGATVGGVFLTYEKDLGAALAHLVLHGNHLARVFYGVVMIVVVFVAPRGLVGELTSRFRGGVRARPKRGAQYISPPPDYDYLKMRNSPVKDE